MSTRKCKPVNLEQLRATHEGLDMLFHALWLTCAVFGFVYDLSWMPDPGVRGASHVEAPQYTL